MANKRITDLAQSTPTTGFELVEVSQRSTTVVRVATTISVDFADSSLNDSANGFITAGFVVGDRVTARGFATSENNFVVGTIAAITSSKMTLSDVSSTLVTATSGPSVTISKWLSARALTSSLAPVRIGFFATTTPTTAETLCMFVTPTRFTFPANFEGSIGAIASIGVNPASSFVMSVFNESTQIGTITISTSGVFTFATTSGTEKVIAAGTNVRVRGPTTADSSITNLIVTLLGVSS